MKQISSLTITILLLSVLAMGDEPLLLIQDVSADRDQYLSYLSVHPEYTSPSQNRINQFNSAQSKKILLEKFEKAQLAYFNQNTDAKNLYQNVTLLALQEHWELLHRRIIFISFLRQAELTSHPDERHEILTHALCFANEFKEDIPERLKEESSIVENQIRAQSKVFSFSDHFPEASTVIINGIIIQHNLDHVLMGPCHKRITLVSDIYQEETQIVSFPNPNFSKQNLKKITDVSCSLLSNASKSAEETHPALFCSPNLIIFNQTQSIGSIKRPNHELSGSQFPSKIDRPSDSPPSKKTWIWIVAGLATAFIVDSYLNPPSEKKIIVRRSGN